MREPFQQDWSPNDAQSPYYVWHMITKEEWLVISRGYPYSVRALIQLHDKTRWSEQARTHTENQAKDLMQALAHLSSKKDWWIGWAVVKSECLADQARESPVLWYPTQERVLEMLHQAGLLKTTEALLNKGNKHESNAAARYLDALGQQHHTSGREAD